VPGPLPATKLYTLSIRPDPSTTLPPTMLGSGRTGPSAGLRTGLALHQKLAAAAFATDKQLYQRQIQAIDLQIDAQVYELYRLTEEEIEIVEDATR
jgi:hypothetical protein